MKEPLFLVIFFAALWLFLTLVFLKPRVRSVLRSVGLGFAATLATLAGVLLLMAANIFVTSQQAVAPTSHASEATPKRQSDRAALATRQDMSMSITPKQLQERFNRLAQSRTMEYRISNIQLTQSTDVADKWLYQFTNRVGILVMVNRPGGDIRSVTYLASGDGSIQSGAHIIFVLTLVVHTLDPAMSSETANQLVASLLDAKPEAGVERVFNGVRYGSLVVPGAGLVIAINPVVPEAERPATS